jgi:hypothetical protein
MSSSIGSDGIRRCHNGHEWNSENIRNVPSGTYCRACHKESRDRQPAIWKARRRRQYFDAVIPVWKACAELTQEAKT